MEFQGHLSNFKVTREKIANFDQDWAFPDLLLQFEFTHGFEMMRKAWHNIEEMNYRFKVTRAEKSTIWIQFE